MLLNRLSEILANFESGLTSRGWLPQSRGWLPQSRGWLPQSRGWLPRRPGYLVEPVVCGLDRRGRPYLCAQDGLGARMEAATFVVAGTAATSLYGAAEALFEPDLESAALVDAACGAMAAGLDRDCLAGRDVVVHLVTPDGATREERRLGNNG